MTDHDRLADAIWNSLSPDERRRLREDRQKYLRKVRHEKYLAYLDSEQWQLLRRLKIEEAKGRCEVCMSKEKIQVHHRTYERLFRESLSDLTVLCDTCHELYHTNLKLRKLTA